MDITIIAIAVLSSLIIGSALGFFVRHLRSLFGKRTAFSQAEVILEQAREEQRTIVLEAKEEALQTRREGESELRERQSEIRSVERRVANREENVEGRARNLEKRENKTNEREIEVEQVYGEAEQLKEQQLKLLESVADLSMDEAKDFIMRQAEDDIGHELAVKYRDMEEEARNEAND